LTFRIFVRKRHGETVDHAIIKIEYVVMYSNLMKKKCCRRRTHHTVPPRTDGDTISCSLSL